MSEAATQKTLVPLEMWPCQALRLPSLAWGGLVAALLIAGALLFRAIVLGAGIEIGKAPADIGFATRVALVASLSIGYTLGVWRWVSSAQLADLAELGALPASELEPQVLQVPRDQLRRSRMAGLAGVVFFFLIIELPGALAGQRPLAAWTSLHSLSYMLLLGLIFFWIVGRAAYFSTGRARLGAVLDLVEIDVLDRRPLRVFGRLGQRNALVWVLGPSIGMLAFVNPEIRIVEALIVLVPLLLVSTAIILAAALLPARELHARLTRAKAEELGRIEAAIRGEPNALAGSPIGRRDPPPSLADLVAYRGLVEAAPTWPFDGSTLRRLGLYLLIPLASWTGGALVERALGALLD